MMSIGLFSYSTRPRGSVVHGVELARALHELGHSVTFYALSKAGDVLFRDLPCRVVLLPAAPAPSDPDELVRTRVDEFRRGVERYAHRHEVYHAQDCLAASGLLTADVRHQVKPVVRTVHHVEPYQSRYLRDCQARSITQADLVLTVSRAAARDVRDQFGRTAPVVHNGVNLERLGAAEAEPALASRLSLPAGARVVLSVGGVEERKNSERSLSAVTRLMIADESLHWIIAGGDSIWEHREARERFEHALLAQPESIRRRVLKTGAVSDAELAWLYRRSSALLCCSLQEGFGLCVLESMAVGLPVVVSRAEPFTEYLDEGTAVFADPTSGEDMSRALSRALNDGSLRERLRLGGIARASGFSWQRVAGTHVEQYRALLQRRSASETVHPPEQRA